MASEKIQNFIILLKTNKPVAIMFAITVIGLFLILGFLIKALVGLVIMSSVPWCEIEKTKCGGQGYHIGCQPEQFPLNNECRNVKLGDMHKKLRLAILNKHNEIRNATASGFNDYNSINKTHSLNFPKASRMREVVWDHQLQQVAELHAINCNFAHDKCRSTMNYSYVGQNIANHHAQRKNDDAIGMLTSLITDWYNERYTVNPKIFEKFVYDLNNGNEHYLVIVNENVEKIGCAYIRYELGTKKKDKTYGYQLTCDYSYSNMQDEAVFAFGEPKTECGSLNSHGESIFSNLCGPAADK